MDFQSTAEAQKQKAAATYSKDTLITASFVADRGDGYEYY